MVFWDYVNNEQDSKKSLDNASIMKYTGNYYTKSTEFLAKYNTVIDNDHELSALIGLSSMSSMR